MLREFKSVRKVAMEIADVADRVMDAYREGDVPYEVGITGELLGAIKDRVNRLDSSKTSGLQWRAKHFKTSSGSGAEEKATGADFMGVLRILSKSYSMEKGFLVQAKRAEPSKRMNDWKNLIKQVKKMLAISPESYVFIYSKKRGVCTFPAISVLGLKTEKIFDLYNHSIERFFEDHFTCFIGDQNLPHFNVSNILNRLNSTSLDVLELTAIEDGYAD